MGRRAGRKVTDEEELSAILRKLAGFLDDGTKTYHVAPEGVPEAVLEQRLKLLINEALIGQREAENKQFAKDAKAFDRSR